MIKSFMVMAGIVLICAGQLRAQAVTHGPVVGGVTSQSAVFVIRVDEAAVIQLQLSKNLSFSPSILSTASYADISTDFFGKVTVADLSAATQYYYRPVINGITVENAAVRSFRTFPPPGSPAEFKFLTGSCQQADPDPNSGIGLIFPKMAMENALFLLHQGDWGYPDTTDIESGTPGNYFALDYGRVQETYRSRYDPAFPMDALLKVMPVDYTYDDHDMIDDNSDYTYPGIANSIKGYMEMFPNYHLPNPDGGIWHKFTCGNADFFMLDNRSQRDPSLESFFSLPPNNFLGDGYVLYNPSPDHRILSGNPFLAGEDQMTWLLRELSNSTADWKFISTGTPFNPALRGGIELALLLQNDPRFNPIITPQGSFTPVQIAGEFADKWAGYPESIIRLLNHIITNKIENVIFLSGDTHTSGIDDGANSIIPELMAGPLDRINSRIVALLEQFGVFIFNRGGQTSTQTDFGNTYGRVSVSGSESVTLDIVSESGNVIASHVVESGFLPSRVGGLVVPAGLAFGELNTGNIGAQAILVVNTSVDPLIVSNIASSDPLHFRVFPKSFTVLPGTVRRAAVTYFPFGTGKTHQALLTVNTNDPDGPIYVQVSGSVAKAVAMADEQSDISGIPYQFKLHQNHPNPFNPRTEIQYSIPEISQVSITVFNVLGERIKTLIKEEKRPGNHLVSWDGTNEHQIPVQSGIYFYTITAGKFKETRKMMLLK
ncbi:MAG: alkaline phosphatase D family protein [Calditrichaceae bacterium]